MQLLTDCRYEEFKLNWRKIQEGAVSEKGEDDQEENQYIPEIANIKDNQTTAGHLNSAEIPQLIAVSYPRHGWMVKSQLPVTSKQCCSKVHLNCQKSQPMAGK